MAEKSIVTQSQLGPIKLALSQEADSLAYHANASLSQAHGFAVWTGPNPDAYGNDLRYYCDSNGDVVGTKMLRLDLGSTSYYAPLLPSTINGQSSSTGINPDLTTLLQPGQNYWVTDFSTQFTGDANLVMSGLLLPHTRQCYWEYGTASKAHGGVVAGTYTSYDSAGHVVGDTALIFIVNTATIWVPASVHMGGPVQGPRLTAPCPVRVEDSGNFTYGTCSMVMDHYEGSPADTAHVRWTGIDGTAPFTWVIQVSADQTTWTDAVYNTNYPYANSGGLSTNSASYPLYEHPGGTCNQTIDWSFTLFTPGPGSNGTMYIRLKVYNTGGTAYSPTITIHIQDHHD